MSAFTAPASSSQQRLWFLDRMEPATTAYHVPIALRLEGALDPPAVAAAMNSLVARHEILRTTFASTDGELVQVVHDALTIAVDELAVDAGQLTAAIHREIHRPFDLIRGPLLRAVLVTESGRTGAVLVLTLHHIVTDGWSMGVLVEEFSELYRAFVEGRVAVLPELPVQYADYVEGQREQEPRMADALAYWTRRLSGPLPAISPPPDHRRPAAFSYRGATIATRLGRDRLDRLQAFASERGTTLFVVLLAGLKALLNRCTNVTDITVGSPVANRRTPDIERLVGLFVNTLVLRTDLSGAPTFEELVRRVRETAVDAWEHQDAPFERVVEAIAPERDRSRAALFQVMFALQNAPLADLRLPGVQVERLDVSTDSAKFDLTVIAEERADGLHLRFEYNTDLYKSATVHRFARHFDRLLERALAHPECPIDALPIGTDADTAEVLGWRGGDRAYLDTPCLPAWFSEVAARCGDATAVTSEAGSLTYAALDRESTQLAHALQRRGVGPETRVGLAMERTPALLVGLLAILKAGGAYVPLDPAYPPARRAFMLADSRVRLVLTDGRVPVPGEIPALDITDTDAWMQEPETPIAPPALDQAAYVIYTSGSTGQPKGVVVTHRNVTRLFQAAADHFTFGRSDVWTLFHSIAFDFSVWELWGALLYGGRLVLASYETSRTPERFYALVADEGVTVLNQTPSAFRQLLAIEEAQARPLALRYVIFGGEALDLDLLAPWVARHGDETPALINMYGITETTVHVTYRRLRSADIAGSAGSLIGQPLGDLQLYVLDRHQQLVPCGLPGELYVGGAGLARGYLTQPALTATRFGPNPFGAGRLYRTGDAARWLASGDLEYLGRLDEQVKLRGFRIELGEIAAVLREHGGLREAVVIARPQPAGDPHLVAYGVAAGAAPPTAATLRSCAQQWLPAHMVPAAFVLLDALPLTRNGKLDRDALPAPDFDANTAAATYRPPISGAEVALAQVWASVLGAERIGLDDNFFERGGDSILSLQVVARARQAGWTITPRQIFELPTLEGLAQATVPLSSSATSTADDPAQTVDRFPLSDLTAQELARLRTARPGVEDVYPLTPLQAGILFHVLSTPDRDLYLEQLHGRIDGVVDPDAFETAWRQVIARHPALRTAFWCDDGPLRQYVETQVPFVLTRLDWTELPPNARSDRLAAWLAADRLQGLDVRHAPLLRVALIRLAPACWHWVWTHHHLLLDGWSLPPLMADVLAAYDAAVTGRPLDLPAVRPYRDYLGWLRQQDIATAAAYWRRTLEGFAEPTTLNVGPRPGTDAPAAGETQTTLSRDDTAALQAWARRHQITLNTLVTGAWARLLQTYSGQTDVAFGVTVAGRPADLADADRMVGLFINTLPLRVGPGLPTGLVPWLQALQQRQAELRDFGHMPLVDLTEYTALGPGQPLLHTLIAFENYPIDPDVASRFAHFRLEPITFVERTNYPIGLAAIPGDQLTLRILFDGTVFTRAAVDALLEHLRHLLRSAARDEIARVGDWALLTTGECAERERRTETPTGPTPRLVHQTFEAQVDAAPDRVAIEAGDERWTYARLNEAANRLAAHLRRHGVGPDTIVGAMFDRSPELYVALLAILKAGGAYLPLDPRLPPARVAAMLRGARVPMVVTTSGDRGRLHAFEGATVCVDEHASAIAAGSTANPVVPVSPGNLAYVIFTSGSTGEPKGVMVPHAGFANLAQAQGRAFGVTAGARVLQFASITFDASLSEVAMALSTGATLVLPDAARLLPDAGFAEMLRNRRVTHVTLPPSMLSRLPDADLPDLECVISAGEACPLDVVERWSHGRVFFNAYGPTETSVCATLGACTSDTSIGRPMANMRAYVLDPHGGHAPIGVAGELFVGGTGVARGYCGRPDLTAYRFVPDPFAQSPGARMYRTGDLARVLPDGRLEFLGRIDRQIKLRGHRIEPGEIEAVLRRYGRFEDAVVVLRPGVSGTPQLIAYGVPAGAGVTPASARDACHDWLPEHEIPSAFVLLEALPLTASGKVDRARLPDPDGDATAVRDRYVAPRTPAERALADAWSAILGVREVGVHDNFFELGGDSILTLQIAGRAARAGWKVEPRQLFDHPTIERLAAVAIPAVAPEGSAVVTHGPIPLTPIQAWFFDHPWKNPHRWNQAVLLEVDSAMTAEVLDRALPFLAAHHDALGLRFTRDSGRWTQRVDRGAMRLPLTIRPLDAGSDHAEIDRIADDAHASLHLTHGPLARAVFLVRQEQPNLLLVVAHHLVIDGVSWRILLDDLQTVCDQLLRGGAPQLPPRTASFDEWSRSLAGHAGTIPAHDFDYWRRMDPASAPAIPLDQPVTVDHPRGSASVTVELTATETAALLERAPRVYRTEINDLLLTAVHAAISGWTRRAEVSIDLEGHGREAIAGDIDLTRTVGWFTSLFPVRLTVEPGTGVGESIRAVKDQLRAVPKRGVTFGICRYLREDDAARALGALPAPEISFNYLGQLDQGIESRYFRLAHRTPGSGRQPDEHRTHALDIVALVERRQLRVEWLFDRSQFREDTIRQVADSAVRALRSIVDHCTGVSTTKVSASDFPLSLLAPEEFSRLLAARPGLEDVYPLAPLQAGMLFHVLAAPGSDVYLEQLHGEIHGTVDPDAFETAWRLTIGRHPILRTAFWCEEGPLHQYVEAQVPFALTRIDWTDIPAEAQAERLGAWLAADRRQGLDVRRAPLMRVSLIRLGPQRWHWVWTHHHLLLDGWSLPPLMADVLAAYDATVTGRPLALPAIRPYRDYLVWLQGQDAAGANDYWRRTLAGFATPTTLNVGPRPGSDAPAAGETQKAMSTADTAALQAWARRHHITLNTLVTGAWARLLQTYSRQTDVVFGVTVAGRPADLAGADRMVGLFINTLPLRVGPDLPAGLVPWLQALQQRQTDLRHFGHVPLVDLAAHAALPPGQPLFETLIAFENYPVDEALTDRFTHFSIHGARLQERTNYPLALSVIPGEALRFRVLYDGRQLSGPAVDTLLTSFEHLLMSAARGDVSQVRDWRLLPDDPGKVTESLSTAAPVPYETLPAWLNAVASRRGTAEALSCDGERMSYAELDRRSNQLACYLRRLGVQPESRVAILLERSMELVVTIAAVLKAGGAYVPIDPAYPAERRRFLVEDSRAQVLVRRTTIDVGVDHPAAEVLLDRDAEAIGAEPATTIEAGVAGDNAAYVIYTSGSTGTPKGCVVTHHNVTRLMAATQPWFAFGESDTWTLFHSCAFDFSVWEIWGALLYGGRLVVVPHLTSRSPEQFYELLERERVTVLNQTPSAFRQLSAVDAARRSAAAVGSLRYVIFGGEALALDTLKDWFIRHGDHAPRLVNMYGITETTVHVTYRPVEMRDVLAGRGSVIGRPIPDLSLHVLDPFGHPAPIGVTGELFVGGAGVSRGYLDRPALTADRFVAAEGLNGGRLYRSGDLARRLAGEDVEYLGRADDQVKVRGFRLELGEIESVLAAHAEVREAAALIQTDTDGPAVVAYVVPREGASISIVSLRTFLGERLPEYMVPAQFLLLDRMPLTPHGKVDRTALTQMAGVAPDLGETYVPPRTEAEATLAGIWSAVLGADRVGVYDNFFALGGDSIRSLQVQAQARRVGLTFDLAALFTNPTVAALAGKATAAGEAWTPVAPFELCSAEDRGRLPADAEDAYPLTELQKGMLFHRALHDTASVYEDVFSYHVRVQWDEPALQAALREVVGRHAVLRSSFVVGSLTEPLQVVHRDATPDVTVTDLRALADDDQEAMLARWMRDEARRPLPIDKAPLIAFRVFRRADDRIQLCLHFHHACLDGWSVATMLTEIFEAYRQHLGDRSPLADPPAVGFRDYVALERAAMASDADRRFWAELLEGAAATSLPRLPGRTRASAKRVARQSIPISTATSTALKRVAAESGLPIRSLLLAAHLRVLSVVANTEDIITGLVTNGRPETEGAERALGLFLNTLPLRLRIGRGSWRDLVRATFAREQAILPHRRFPLHQIQRLTGGAPLFETDFNFVHFHVFDRLTASGHVEYLGGDSVEETNFVLAADFSQESVSGHLRGRLAFDAAVLSEDQIARYAGYYRAALDAMAAGFDDRYDTQSLIGDDERRELRTAGRGPSLPIEDASTLHHLVERQVARTPGAIAVMSSAESMTFAALDRRANQLARHLRDEGVEADGVVGVCLESSVDRVIAMLAVLKAGAAYLPLDPKYPAERLALMLRDSAAPVVVCGASAPSLPAGVRPIRLPGEWAAIGAHDDTPLAIAVHPEQLAYVLYTSGSTGQPKGVQISHRAIVNHMRWMHEAFPLGEMDAVLQKTPFGFDASVWEFWAPLSSRARLVVADPDAHRDPAALVRVIQRERITVLQVVPTLLGALCREPGFDRCRSLQRIFAGGEALTTALAAEVARLLPTTALINLYGPTEGTIDTSARVFQDHMHGASVPIGGPIAGMSMWVEDRWGQEAPTGTYGELVIAGAGLARGYLGRPAQTAAVFVPSAAAAGARAYRTGDLARVLPDGDVEFIGRADAQVKFRGFRIELGEIEAALEAQPDIRQAVVSVHEQPGADARLVGYVRSGSTVGGPDRGIKLRQALRARLPEHMVPSALVFVETFPLTPSGKVDRRALQPPPAMDTGESQPHQPPRTEVEHALASAWAQALRVKRVSIRDNFFDLGGDSIMCLQIVASLRESGWVVTPRDVFERGTIEAIAPMVVPAADRGAPAAAATGVVPLTPIQRAFLELEPQPLHHWNQAVLLAVSNFSSEAFQQALTAVVRHHDSFRLRVTRDGDRWTQRYADEHDEADCLAVDLTRASSAQRARQLQSVADLLHGGLDISHGPVVRAAYLNYGDEGGRVLMVAHHLAVDAVSWRILLHDLAAAYAQARAGDPVTLAPSTATYQAWAHALERYAASDAMEAERTYWLAPERLAAASLPADLPGGDGDNVERTVGTIRLDLDPELTQRLTDRVRASGHRIDEALIWAVSRSLAKWTGQDRVSVALEGHGREDVVSDLDLSRMVGWCTSLFPISLAVDESAGPLEDFAGVVDQLRATPARGVGYGILRYLSPDAAVRARLAGAPQPDISVNYLGQLDLAAFDGGEFSPAPEDAGRERAAHARRRFLIDVIAHQRNGRLHVEWLYSEARHRRETIDAVSRSAYECLVALANGGHTTADAAADASRAPAVVEMLPLTPLQAGILFHAGESESSGIYVQQLVLTLVGHLDARAFEIAWNAVTERHTILRTGIERPDLQDPIQVVRASAACPVEWLDWRETPAAECHDRLRSWLEDDRRRGFALDQPPLMRVTMIREADRTWRMVWTQHHVVLDGWSTSIVLQEVMTAYRRARGGPDAGLPEARPFSDYVRWLERQDHGGAERYWRDVLHGFNEPVRLGLGSPSGEHAGFGESTRVLPDDLTAALGQLARAHRVTLNTVAQAIWAILLGRFGATSDVVFGVTVSGRPADLAGAQRMVGPFINTLPLRVDVGPEQTASAFLRAVQARQSAMSQHEASPLVDVLGWSDVPRSDALFETILVFENYPQPREAAGVGPSSEIEVRAAETFERSHYPMTCYVMPGEHLTVRLTYQQARFDDAAVNQFLDRFAVIARELVEHPDRPLGRIVLLTEHEHARAIDEWNATGVAFDRAPVHVRITQQAARTPDAVAVVCGGLSLTYRDLDRHATELARVIASRGVGRGQLVAVCVERSIDLVVSLLGVLKSGAAYVPLDPGFPIARLRWMLEHSGAPLLITSAATHAVFGDHATPAIRVDALPVADGAAEPRASDPLISGDDLAYVIYTSGSTGTPKGVAVRHEALANFLGHFERAAALGTADRLVSVTTVSFDIAGLELYLPLITGARLIVAASDDVTDADRLARLLDQSEATVMQATPATWRMLLDAAWRPTPRLRMWCGGEAFPRQLAEALTSDGLDVWNLYGPTETTIWSSLYTVRRGDDAACIGHPLANTTMYVVDPQGNPVPVGVTGELLIGGTGLARGYWKRPDETAARFVPDPFGPAGARAYRTGDLVRRRPDGAIVFVGRVDGQVKLRGFRIELGEIESVLEQDPGVSRAVVQLKHLGAADHLVAYVVTADGRPVEPALEEQLRARVRGRLPEYMTPTWFVWLRELPLTPNRKVDRKRLPDPDIGASAATGGGDPRTALERVLVALWQKVLQVPAVGIRDDFFRLGGHSLLVAQMLTWLRRMLRREIPMRIVFDATTVERLAQALVRTEPEPGVTERVAEAFLRVQSMSAEERAVLKDRSEVPGHGTR